MPRRGSKNDSNPVFVEILRNADPRTIKLPLFVVKNGQKAYLFKFEDISLNQFKPDHTSQLVCANHPRCNSRILVKNRLTADLKCEQFASFENWEIERTRRISLISRHHCNGPTPQQLIQARNAAETFIQPVVKSPEGSAEVNLSINLKHRHSGQCWKSSSRPGPSKSYIISYFPRLLTLLYTFKNFNFFFL